MASDAIAGTLAPTCFRFRRLSVDGLNFRYSSGLLSGRTMVCGSARRRNVAKLGPNAKLVARKQASSRGIV